MDVAPIISQLDVTMGDLKEGDLVECAIVILKISSADGSTTLRHIPSPGLGWIEQVGMLHLTEASEIANLSHD